MPEIVKWDSEYEVNRILSTGSITHDDMQLSLQKARENGDTEITKILATASYDSLPHIGNLFQFVTGLDFDVKIAIVPQARFELTQEEEFIRLTAGNRALPVKFFHSEEEAVSWLHSSG